MATPIAFVQANCTLEPPAGEVESAAPIPALRADGRILSCWRPSAEELQEIIRTGRIWLATWGAPFPVHVTGHQAEVI